MPRRRMYLIGAGATVIKGGETEAASHWRYAMSDQ